MKTPAGESQEIMKQSVADTAFQKQRSGESTFQFADNRPQATAQRKLQELVNSSQKVEHAAQFDAIANSGDKAIIQRQLIDGCNVYVDAGGYPVWEQNDVKWHLTMKDKERWHVTTEDRGMSYWFHVDAGKVTPVKPKKKEYGSHKEKHASLDEAPDDVRSFIAGHISEIIRVKDKEP